MSDLDTIREKHAKVPSADPTSFLCDWCEVIWPCETSVVLDALDRLRSKAWQALGPQTGDDLIRELDAARADADRLAGSLREMLDALDGKGERRFRVDPAREALRQHDEASA